MKILDRFFKLAGMVIAASLDLAVGSLIMAVMAAVFSVLGYQIIVPWHYYVIGALVALSPDLDVFTSYNVMSGDVYQKKHHHEKIPHYPLLILPMVLLIGIFFIILCKGAILPIFWVIAVESCLLWHYLHDSKWTGGYGINWLFPFRGLEILEILNREDEYNRWLHGEILKPSLKTAVGVLATGIIIGVVASQYSHSLLAGAISTSVVLTLAVATWILHRFSV